MEFLTADRATTRLRESDCPHRGYGNGLGCFNCVRDALMRYERIARDIRQTNAVLLRERDEALASVAVQKRLVWRRARAR